MNSNYFENLEQLLQIEKEADIAQFANWSAKASLQEKVANGFSWSPIIIKDTEIGIGDYLNITIERTKHLNEHHFFKPGAEISLTSPNAPKNGTITGVVTKQSPNIISALFRIEDLPDWADQGKLSIHLLFDNNSYKEMEQALKKAKLRQSEHDRTLFIDIITAHKYIEFNHTFSENNSLKVLNHSQNIAVQKILKKEPLTIVYGPPGTGKTTTLTHALKELHHTFGEQILVTAPSNTAVDVLTERLHRLGLQVVRIGNPARITNDLQSLSLEEQIKKHKDFAEIKKLKKQAAAYKDLAFKYKRSFGKEERDQRNLLRKEAKSVMQQAHQLEEYITQSILSECQIITATLVGANHYLLKDKDFSTVVIDEAGQALEPACWIPILKCKDQLILAGDPNQLPPTVKSQEAQKKGLNITLLEKLMEAYPSSIAMLKEQYRMNQDIMQFSADYFYESNLYAADSVAQQLIEGQEKAILFIDTAGSGFEEKSIGSSTANEENADFITRFLITQIENHSSIKENSIGIIAPYQAQVNLLKERLSIFLSELNKSNTINTIDGFQGQEKDIILIDLVRSNDQNQIGFLSDIRRMNVAITRAKKLLIIVGDSATLAEHPFYQQLMQYFEQKEAYHSVWEWM